MPKGIIISAFATCGKSFLGKKYSNVIDLESSNYKHDNQGLENIPVEMWKGIKRKINPDWPKNYYEAIKEAMQKYDIILVQLKPEHFDYFDKNNIKYSIAYPNINNWKVVEKRCLNRGNNDSFINNLKMVFIPFYEDSIHRNFNKLYLIDADKTLEDYLIEDNIILKSKWFKWKNFIYLSHKNWRVVQI